MIVVGPFQLRIYSMISKLSSCVSPTETLPSEGGIEQCGKWCIDIFELCLNKFSFQHNSKLFFASFFFLIKGVIALIYI